MNGKTQNVSENAEMSDHEANNHADTVPDVQMSQ